MNRLNQKAAKAHGDYSRRLAFHAVDHEVVCDYGLADVDVVEFADEGAGFIWSRG